LRAGEQLAAAGDASRCSGDDVESLLQSITMGAVRQNAESQREAPFRNGAGEHHSAALIDAVEEFPAGSF
jgi:hypothetical protein